MKDLKNLKGAKTLNKIEQKSVKGGIILPCVYVHGECTCPDNFIPEGSGCKPDLPWLV